MMLKDFLIFVRHSGRLIAIIMLTLFSGCSHRCITRTWGTARMPNTAEILTVQVVLLQHSYYLWHQLQWAEG